MSNSLATVHPELVAEWSEKNLPLTPDSITFGSNKKVWWKGACGHEWETSIKARSSGEKCPICSGARVIAGINDLATLEPLLVKQWSKKNKIKPTEVSIGSHKKVIWRCEKGHEWEAAVKSRTINKTGCPYCSHNKVLAGFNDLATLLPDIAAEWSDRNYPLLPTQVTVFANRKAWWKCKDCGREWNTLISTRSGGSKCPYCSGYIFMKGFNDLQTTHPEIVSEWSEKNLPLKPDEVNAKSRKNVWWKCRKCGNEWKSVINARVKGTVCPVCAEREVLAGYNDLATTDSQLLSEWDYEQNKWKQTEVSRNSAKRAWWKCRHGHSWSMKINERTILNKGCRICEQEYLSLFPALAVSYYSNKKGLKAELGSDRLLGVPLETYIASEKLAIESGSADENIEIMKAYMCKQRGIRLIKLPMKGTELDYADSLKKAFQSVEDGRTVGYKTFENVLHLWEGKYDSRTAQSFYDWAVIARHFEAMRLLGELSDSIKSLPSMDGQMTFILDGRAEEKKTSAFTFSQEIIDAVLANGSGFSEGKMRIYEQFEKSLSAKENADFLKNEYGWGGSYPVIIGAGIDESHDGKGITITKGIGKENPHITLSWSQVEKRIGELIRMDRYLNPKEKERYPQWLESQEERRAKIEETKRNREILSNAPPEQEVEPTEKEPEEAEQPQDVQYEYHLGDKVYIGASEYEILSVDDERVMLYDYDMPLFNKEFSRTEFDRKVRENPMNEHLIVKEEPAEERNEAEEVQTNMGSMPIEDYREIVASQSGFDSYDEMYKQGYRIGNGYDKEPEPVVPAWEQKKKVKGFDLHPDVPMADRHIFNLRENEVETVGKKERFRRNIMAIQLLKKCQEENRFATPEEQIVLSKYVGWGGLSEAFDENNPAWATEYLELSSVLTPEEYASARESTLTAFYTPPEVITAIYKAMEQIWRCEKGHEWIATVKSRTINKTGCPYCSHNKVLAGFNDLATLFPEVADEWSDKNEKKPTEVTAFANSKAWWKCKICGYEWNTLISTCSGGSKCPCCSGYTFIKGKNDLKSTYPLIAKEWSEKNLSLKPDEVNAKSRKNVWWRCSKCGNEWKSVINARVKGTVCPVCAEREVLAGYNDLATTDSRLLSEWDYEKNKWKPTEVSRNSAKRAWWKCRHGHSWSMKINERTVLNKGCRICEQEYLSLFPALAISYYANLKGLKVELGSDRLFGIPLDVYIPLEQVAIQVNTDSEKIDIAKQCICFNLVSILFISEIYWVILTFQQLKSTHGQMKR